MKQLVNDCQQCEDWDIKTKEMVGQFLGQDEVYLIAVMLADGIRAKKKHGALPARSKREKMQSFGMVMFMEQLVGKMAVSMNPHYLAKFKEELEKAHIPFKINHGKCPHKEKPDAAIPAAIGSDQA